ncbi:unnamed protein product [Hymenolepis diminuta]|uniref:Dynein light chain n=1 Tax=Hymenolepis diminuta TaxID=6216 RepID=A0A0R3SA92_HYMDI|nr:unnamed protein product [Hymenolepis diminuta]VUZ51500.1 unnamed protein product [Hymenolepis diminuta]
MTDYPIINVQTDMEDEKRHELEQIVANANRISGAANIQEMAADVKRECDSRFGGHWHCHVGPRFGSSFPYEANTYFYAEWSNNSILVYKFM